VLTFDIIFDLGILNELVEPATVELLLFGRQQFREDRVSFLVEFSQVWRIALDQREDDGTSGIIHRR